MKRASYLRKSKRAFKEAQRKYLPLGYHAYAGVIIENGGTYEDALSVAEDNTLKERAEEVASYLECYNRIKELTRMTLDPCPTVKKIALARKDMCLFSYKLKISEKRRIRELKAKYPSMRELNDLCESAWTILNIHYPRDSQSYPEEKDLMIVTEDGFGQAYFRVYWVTKDGQQVPEYEVLPLRTLDKKDYKTAIDLPEDQFKYCHLFSLMKRAGMEVGKRYSHEQVRKIIAFYSGALKVPGELWKNMTDEGEQWKVSPPKI